MASNTVSIRVVGDSKDLKRAFKDAEASSKSFGDRFKKDSETLARLAKRGAQAIGALTAAVVGISLKGGVERLMGLERANKQLGQLGVATKDADGLMDSLLQTLLGTPFALDKGAASLAGFVASGRDLKDVPRLVQQVTDAAAFGNTTLEEMDFIWQRIQTTGRVTNRELRMLAQRNIPVYTQLAGAIGTTADEVFDMASNGELSADLFFDSWQKAAEGTEDGTVRIAGAAKAMGETTEGAWGNMRTSMSRFGATLLEDVFPLAKDAFNAISEGFDRMGEVVSDAFANLDTSGLEDFISRIPDMMEDAAESVVEFWQATETLRDVATTAFRGIAEVVTNQLAVALAAVLVTLRAISKHPLIVAITAVGFAIGTIAERAEEAWAELKELRDILEDVEVSGNDARQAFDDLLTSEQIFMLNQYGLSTDELARMSLPELEQALADVREAQKDSIATDIEAQHQFDQVHRILQFVIEGRREHAEAIREERSAHLETAEAQHRAEAATASAGEEIETTTERLERMGLAEEETTDKTTEFADNSREQFQKLSDAAEAEFEQAEQSVDDFITGFEELPERQEITLDEWITNMQERTAAIEQWYRDLNILAANGMEDFAEEMEQGGFDATQGLVDEAVKTIGTEKGRLLEETASAANAVGRELARGMSGGIRQYAGEIGEAAVAAVNAAVARAKTAARIESPSELMAEEIGRPLAEGIAKGVEDSNAPSDALQSAVTGLPRMDGSRVNGAGGGSMVVYLTVNALDPQSAGEAVVRALEDWRRSNGDLPFSA